MIEHPAQEPLLAGEAPIVLAPMDGVVDWSMRDVLTRLGGIDLCVTEFVRVVDQPVPAREFFKNCPELKTRGATRAGVPVMIQLLGGLPEPMAQSAARAAALGAPGIDLNFGCPAKTVNRHDGGAALLKDPARVYNVVKAVRAAVPQAIPVSAKMRLGFADKSLFLEIALAAEEAGAQWLAVHARTRDEGYRPPAHWDYIARICEALRIPTIANGEIWTSDDYDRCRGVTGCAAIMLGRGLIAAPDLALRAKTPSIDPLAWPAALSLLLKFTLLSQEARAPLANSERYAVCRCKQWLKQLGRSYPEAIALFAQIKALESFATLIATLTHLLQELPQEGPQEGPQELPQELLQKEAHAKSAHLFQVPLSLLRCRQKPADAKGRRI